MSDPSGNGGGDNAESGNGGKDGRTARLRQNVDKATYETGYGKPPVQHRFKKGNQAARGRQAKPLSHHAIVVNALNEKVVVNDGQSQRKVTKEVALVTATVNDALRGDRQARKIVFDFLMSDLRKPVLPSAEDDVDYGPEVRHRIELMVQRSRQKYEDEQAAKNDNVKKSEFGTPGSGPAPPGGLKKRAGGE